MHQHPRPPPRTASPASSPKTNPTRTNNSREEETNSPRRSSNLLRYSGDEGNADGIVPTSNGPSKDSVRKLDQIIQSRIHLPVVITQKGTKKVNKWFQIETDDTNSFRQELSVWKHCGGLSDRPPPLVIETYIDASELGIGQSLVIVDESGKRWDVLEALNSPCEGDSRQPKISHEVVLERWIFELKDPSCDSAYDFGSTLPTVYKKFIVFFRSLYATTKFVPAGRLVKTIAKSGPHGGLFKVNCRILNSKPHESRFDLLTHPLYENGNIPVMTEYVLGVTETPVGQVYAQVSYRNDCNFRIDDSESLLSSRFLGADEHFRPSLGIRGASCRSATQNTEVESIPKSRPLQVSRNSIVSLDGATMARRPSVSFQPFKAGSLSSSPGQTKLAHRGEMIPPQSSQSLPRNASANSPMHTRNRSFLTTGTPATLRGPQIPPENISPVPTSASPKPGSISKYSSSFNRRRGLSSYGAASRNVVDDDQGSSGKHSLSSSAQHGSVIVAEVGAGGSSESFQTDDDNISEFLKVLDRQKNLKSFEMSSEAAAKRTSAQLSRYQSLRDSHNALTESMTSSALLYRSSNSSSRQLSGMPPMTAVTSMSISSSPGKPVSPHTPHTPHTPAIPSRLSANSIVEYIELQKPSSQSRTESEPPPPPPPGNATSDDPNQLAKTNAIDIPSSPRAHYPYVRRFSLLAQNRSLAAEEDLGDMPFGNHRSMSLGAGHDGDVPCPGTLLRLGPADKYISSPRSSLRDHQPKSCLSEPPAEISNQVFSSPQANDPETEQETSNQLTNSKDQYCSRLGRISLRHSATPSQEVFESSLADRETNLGTGDHVGIQCNITRSSVAYEAEDEPLLFQMSEIGRDNPRTSAYQPAGTSTGEQSGHENPRGSDSSPNRRINSHGSW